MPFVALLIARGFTARAAKAIVIGGMIALAVAGFFIAKAIYDGNVIERHNDKVIAEDAKGTVKANDQAADQRLKDQRRQDSDERKIRDAVDAQPAQPLTARQRARACAILQEQAERTHTQPPASCGPRSE